MAVALLHRSPAGGVRGAVAWSPFPGGGASWAAGRDRGCLEKKEKQKQKQGVSIRMKLHSLAPPLPPPCVLWLWVGVADGERCDSSWRSESHRGKGEVVEEQKLCAIKIKSFAFHHEERESFTGVKISAGMNRCSPSGDRYPPRYSPPETGAEVAPKALWPGGSS